MAQEGSNRSELIVRLAAIARGLEDEGQYNVAKVYRALALGALYRATMDRPRIGGDLEREMADVLELLRPQGIDQRLTRLLDWAGTEATESRWPILAEITTTFVCRHCGEVIVGNRPDLCPNCRARQLTLQEIIPIYFLETMEPAEIISALAGNLAEVERIIEGVREVDVDRGPWPLRQILIHMLGAERLLVGRARRMLEEDEPELGSVAPTEVMEDAGEGSPSVAELLRRYQASRHATSELARKLSPEQWQRSGYHAEWGRLSVQSQLAYFARHEQSHIAELEARSQGR